MRDALPKRGPWRRESTIVNLDNTSGTGTHWVCFKKYDDDHVEYFDSYGDLRPPLEVERYLKGNQIYYNDVGYQSVNKDSEICGHLCLAFLSLK